MTITRVRVNSKCFRTFRKESRRDFGFIAKPEVRPEERGLQEQR
jgi:hypothetical protein